MMQEDAVEEFKGIVVHDKDILDQINANSREFLINLLIYETADVVVLGEKWQAKKSNIIPIGNEPGTIIEMTNGRSMKFFAWRWENASWEIIRRS